MNRFKTYVVGIISIDGLQQDFHLESRNATAPRFSLPRQPGLWPEMPESVVSADNEQLQFELESVYLEFMHQVT